jgi:hypothetical protein
MTIEKTDGVWAATGEIETDTTLTTAKKAAGFVPGDKAARQRFNYLLNRIDEKIDEIIEERVNSYYDDATDHQAMIMTRIWDDPWSVTSETANTISSGATKELRDICVFFSSDNTPRLMLLDNANCKIEVWNPRTLTSVITTNALSDDLPSGGGQTWEPYSMCTDGTYVYVMFADTNAAPDTHQIQAWLIDETQANWSVRSGWAATGSALTGTGNGPGQRDGEIFIADDDYLACLCGWNTVSAVGSAAIIIVDITDGTFAAGTSGAGDCPTADSANAAYGCSDGTNIYFQASGTTSTDSYYCSATIANPQAGCGGTGYPLTVSNPMSSHGIACCGAAIITMWGRATGEVSTDNVLLSHTSGDVDLDIIIRGQNAAATPLIGDEYIVEDFYASVFDGINLWMLVKFDNELTTNGQFAVLKLDVAKISLYDVNQSRQMEDIISGVFFIAPENAIGVGESEIHALAFDGRDIWAMCENAASQDLSGDVYRLPLALLRS